MKTLQSKSRAAGGVLLWAVLLAGGVLFFFPLFWTVTTALKTFEQANAYPPVWIPRPFMWSNFKDAWTILPQPFQIFVLNTYTITFLSTLGNVLSSAIVATASPAFASRGATPFSL